MTSHILQFVELSDQDRAVLAEDQELSPNDVADILGISRPLVVHRMDIGDLPFRYVGKHRRTKLKDALTLKTYPAESAGGPSGRCGGIRAGPLREEI
ncbi:hypothetical protein [Bradyrhizobium sp. C-145]|uniref:hypothetical protein n=1 Tax=Bradyrhizobium sp. C-145 TaxID=574727 RepID=UPI0031F95F95